MTLEVKERKQDISLSLPIQVILGSTKKECLVKFKFVFAVI